jgi:broad specificity phosphatase PhoE
MTIVDLVPHMDAGDRNEWMIDQNERPLTKLGHRQSQLQADALVDEPDGQEILALYSSPALRARETLGPFVDKLGLEIEITDGLGDNETWRVPDGWDHEHNQGANVSPYAAGMAMAALWDIQLAYPEGRVVASSHGHVIPALVSFLIAAHGLEGVPGEFRRGQWYRVHMDGADIVAIDLLDTPDFPS